MLRSGHHRRSDENHEFFMSCNVRSHLKLDMYLSCEKNNAHIDF